MAKPTVATALIWLGDLRFTASTKGGALTLDGDSTAAPSPVDALAASLAGCMAADVVDILIKGRHELVALEADLVAERSETPPRRFLRVTLRFVIRGTVPGSAVERAITLSREKYCSVWHSLKDDIEFLTSYEVTP
jgi:putative redox protein